MLIIGLGLAGAALAWRLAARGLRPVVVDRGGPSATRVAAGLITPITGKRLAMAAGWRSLWPVAKRFYRSVERAVGCELLAEQSAKRFFASAEERALFEERLSDRSFAQLAHSLTDQLTPEGVMAPWGGVRISPAARLDTRAVLQATRDWLAQRSAYFEAEIAIERGLVVGDSVVRVPELGLHADRVVLCTGYSPIPCWPDSQPTAPTKGEVLLVEAPGLHLGGVIHCGVWVVPEEDGRYLVGATQSRERLDCEPSEEGKSQLIDKLRAVYSGEVRVIDHRAAVRPATTDRKPLVGFSRETSRVCWLNGLGSKGALIAPALAADLARRCDTRR